MDKRVLYYSATGNTRKVALAIAAAAGCEAAAIGDYRDDGEPIGTLFLGAAVYATHEHGLHAAFKDFVAGFDWSRVGRVALFSTGFIHSEAIAMMTGLVSARGVAVAPDSFFCLGRFALFNLGHPNATDLEKAAAFAKRFAS